MKFLKISLLTLVLSANLFLPGLALAQDDPANLQTCDPDWSLKQCQQWILGKAGGGPSGYGSNTTVDAQTLAQKVGQVIGMVLSVFGVVFFCLVVYSGIQWMTAGGNEEKVTHARERVIRAAIGLGIVMMSYALTSFIVDRMRPSAPANGAGTPALQCTQENYQQTCTAICGEDIIQGCDNEGNCMCEPAGGA